MTDFPIPAKWQWFPEGRFGLFIHWGPYARYARGEQVLFREHLDQQEYARQACAWAPRFFDAAQWAETARAAGCRYAVLTTRHHDGFCMWDSQLTNYTSAAQAAGRDFVGEYVEAFRQAGLRVGLYYSLADWRIPAYWEGPQHDPQGWADFRAYVHGQVRELLTRYGKIDELWFDGAWPHSALDWKSPELVDMIRALQPDILINNRLGLLPEEASGQAPLDDGTLAEGALRVGAPEGALGVGESRRLGDFGTPEHHITPDPARLWESCQVTTWRLWGFTEGERWRPADLLLDMLVESASKGGNLLLNVGPDGEGRFPPQAVERLTEIGRWLEVHGEAVYGSEAGEVCEFITYGRQTRKGNNLYLIIRFWDGRPSLRLAGLATAVRRAVLLTSGTELPFEQDGDQLVVSGLPRTAPTTLFPVIKLECSAPPQPAAWAADRLWSGDPRRMTPWAGERGTGFDV
jgi:alpha-L-fucosidase